MAPPSYSKAPAAEQLLSPDIHDAPHHGPGADSPPMLSAMAAAPTPRKRYWLRTFILLAIPIAVAGYFYWIWLYLLERDFDEAVKFGSRTEIWVYYSWFIIGVFALDWSKHGLVGVEVAMLESPAFKTPHLIGLLSHSEGTWGGPGGWIRAFKQFVKRGNHGAVGSSMNAYKLWYLLAFLSLSLFVGLPLSGLTMELSDGYVGLPDAPLVVGRNTTNFHSRYKVNGEGSHEQLTAAWRSGSPPTLPGIGIIYTAPWVKRGDYDDLGELPNSLPLAEGIPEIFVSPQAQAPVSGTAWGMRLSYNCSTVENASEFEILGKYKGDMCKGYRGIGDCAGAYVTDVMTNIWSYKEIGARMLTLLEGNETRAYGSSYDGTEPDFFATKNESQYDIIEIALWQVRRETSYKPSEIQNFNNTMGTIIKGFPSPFMKAANDSWIVNATFFDDKNYTRTGVAKNEAWATMVRGQPKTNNEFTRLTLDVSSGIGVRCVVKSELGNAEVDAKKSTFVDFKKQNPTPYTEQNVPSPIARLGSDVEDIMGDASLGHMFSSLNARVTHSTSNAVAYDSFISSDDLQKTTWAAYGKELLEKMYDGRYGFEGAFEHAGLTSSKKGKVLTKGELHPLVSVIPFGIWAVGCIVLAVVYGFRKRLSDSLSGFSFFRFGVYVADDLRGAEELFTATEAEEVKKLWQLPGSLETMQAIPMGTFKSTSSSQGGHVFYDAVKEPEVRTTGY